MLVKHLRKMYQWVLEVGGPEVWQGKLEKWKWMKLEFGGGVMSNLRKKD